ncbi:cytochrome P450 [Chromobacterium amazonense]|uniref:cytochrome P450 n=1 Tax=Chromobacterium amazonense TaxID=1382803 RepID=UPI001FD21FBF|nr:cytochrome P450 [Chromobacterium amazonense]
MPMDTAGIGKARNLVTMNTTPNSSPCPFHSGNVPPQAPLDAWPPGPPSGLTGWGLLWRMARGMPEALAAWQREFGDVVHLRTWPEHQIVVADPTLARELLVGNRDKLTRWERARTVFRRMHGDSVLVAEGEAWQRKRMALHPEFSRQAAHSFVPALTEIMDRAYAAWPQTDANWPIEQAFTSLGMELIVGMAFSDGMERDEARRTEQACRALMAQADAEFYHPWSWPDWMPWQRARRQAQAQLDQLIERRLLQRLAMPLANRPDDLLSRLLRLHNDDQANWPLSAVRAECKTAFLAGHETVASTLTWWAWCMASHPDAQHAARAEVVETLGDAPPAASELPALRYLSQTLQETMRLYPAAPVLISRRASCPVTLGHWRFPAGTLFLVPVQLMHHDARWFPEPRAFRPERFRLDGDSKVAGACQPFGSGPRVCLGQHLAQTEMTLAAAMLLQRFYLSVPDGMTPPQAVLHVTQRPAQPLRLALRRAP